MEFHVAVQAFQQRYGSAAFGIKHQAVDLRGVRAVLQKVRRDAVRVCGSVRVAEAARIGGNARIKAVRDLRRDLRTERRNQTRDELACRACGAFYPRFFGKRAAGRVVVDGKIRFVAVGLQRAEQRFIGHINRHDMLRLELAVFDALKKICEFRRHGVCTAEHDRFAERDECAAERRSAAERIAVRRAVAEDQNFVCTAQEMCGILQICHKRDQAFGRKLHPKALLSLNLYGKLIFSRFQGRAECAKCWRCTQWNPSP